MMKRLIATIWCDIRVQFRNRFYYATVFVLAFLILILRQLSGIEWGWLLPLILLLNLNFTGFYFIGGLLLLEKDEGTLKALVTTPFDSGVYLLSKLITLNILIIVESIVLVLVLNQLNFNLIWLIVGVVLAASFYILAGFLAVSRYDSISDYLLPSVAYSALASIPLLTGFARWESAFLYVHPLQAALVLLSRAFISVDGRLIIYGIGYSGLWFGLLYFCSKKAFWRIVRQEEGEQ